MSAAPSSAPVTRPLRPRKGPASSLRSSVKSQGAAPAVPVGWSAELLEEFADRFVSHRGVCVAGPVGADGRTDWAPVRGKGGRRLRTSVRLLKTFLEGGWSGGRLAVALPDRVRDVVLDVDVHGTTPEEFEEQSEAARRLIDRLLALRLPVHVERTPRGLRVLVPIREGLTDGTARDSACGGVLVREVFARLLRNQKLVEEDLLGDMVRVGRASLTGLPFSWGDGSAVLRNGSDDSVVPLSSPEAAAEAFGRYLRLHGVGMDRLVRLSLQHRRQVGRPLGGAASTDSSSMVKGKTAALQTAKASGIPSRQTAKAVCQEQDNNDNENNYLRFPLVGSPRERSAQLVENEGLDLNNPLDETPGNSRNMTIDAGVGEHLESRHVGRHSKGAASPDSSSKIKGKDPSDSTTKTSHPEQDNGKTKNNYLGSQSGPGLRDEISHLIDNAGLGWSQTSPENPGNSRNMNSGLGAKVATLRPEGLVPGQRGAATLALAHRLIGLGWTPEDCLRGLWEWLTSLPAGSSKDFDADPLRVLNELARLVVERYDWRAKHPGRPSRPHEPDPEDVRILVEERGLKPSMARHVAVVLEALRQRRAVGEEVVVSRRWLGLLTGIRKPAILAEVRRQLIGLGILEETAAADRRHNLATVCVVKSLILVDQVPVVRLADAVASRGDELPQSVRERLDRLRPERQEAVLDDLRLSA
jgi:hypothetical protein